MREGPLRLAWLAAAALAGCTARGAASAGRPESPASAPAAGPSRALSPQATFESTCSSCHDLSLPRALRLDRAGWEEVVRRMVEERGATWITKEEARIIVDYLAEHHGPGA